MQHSIRLLRHLPVALVFFIIACQSPSAPDTAVKIDSLVSRMAKVDRFNGNVLVADHGKVIYNRNVGVANFATGEPLNDSTLFELASVSKQFTAMGIMMLKEEGKLNYADDVRKYIPEIPYEGITIRHLLTHTSGLPEYEQLLVTKGDPKKIAFNADLIAALAKYHPPVLFAPGSRWEYSNTGYALLASVIEKVSGATYGEFLAARIFKPLGMTRTRVYNTRRSGERIDNYAYGFVYSDSLQRYVLPDSLKSYGYVYSLDGIQGDGVVNSTTPDLLRWDRALYTEKLIKQSTLKDAFTPVTLNDSTTFGYGFGWSVLTEEGVGKVVQHSGGWPGYHTFIRRMLDKEIVIIVLSNNEGRSSRMANAINAILTNKEYELPYKPVATRATPDPFFSGKWKWVDSYYTNFTLDLAIHGDSLLVTWGPETVHFEAESPTKFFLARGDAKLEVRTDAAGKKQLYGIFDGLYVPLEPVKPD